jgi:hypothetical protein
MLEKAYLKYLDLKESYQKAVGFCPIQAFPAGFDAGWEAAKKAYEVELPKEEK